MKLTSNRTFWQSRGTQTERFDSLRTDVSCDTVIVGGGIVGALAAYQLSRRHSSSIVLVDKRHPGNGSTSASTALLIYELDIHLTDLVKKIGKKKAVRIYKLSLKSVRLMRKLMHRLGVPAAYRTKKSLYVAFTKKDANALKKEYDLRKKVGFNVRFLTAQELKREFQIDGRAGIISQEAAQVDPYQLTNVLLQKARENGASIHGTTEIASLDSGKDGCTLVTTAGNVIRARTVIMATGYESTKYLKKKLADLKSSYVIVSKPVPGLRKHWLSSHLFWETARPYLYVRTTDDGRIMVGGEDEDFADEKRRDALLAKKSRLLAERFRDVAPDLPFVTDYAWAGTFAETPDGVGYIGMPKEWKDVYFVLGFGGNGITFSVLAIGLLLGMLRGKPSPDARLFSFDRRFHRKARP